MAIMNTQSGTRVDEIADQIFRISTPAPPSSIPGGFTFNVFLIRDERPLLFHTGPRSIFPGVHEALSTLIAVEQLQYIGFSHFESDECGSLNPLLELAPGAAAVCSRIGAMTSITDFALRAPRALGDGECLELGEHTVEWLDMPHVPHSWDCGLLFESKTRTLLCSDLFTQPGDQVAPLTESDILESSEGLRRHLEYYAHAKDTGALLEKAACFEPEILACMHGSAWRGDGAALLRRLAARLVS